MDFKFYIYLTRNIVIVYILAYMEQPKLFNVKLPQTNKASLSKEIEKLDRRKNPKNLLFFHYSEFLLRANRNPFYRSSLNSADLSAIDGKGLHYAMWSTMRNPVLPRVFSFAANLPRIITIPLFVGLFPFQLISNLILGFFTIIFRYNFTKTTKNKVILGRDYVYDLLTIAQKKKWKTLIIGGSKTGDEITTKIIHRLFPDLKLISWTRDSKSLLMKDQFLPKFVGSTINSENICQIFPDLWEARNHIKKTKPDLILVCLGGASGKQEFFLEYLKKDPYINFKLATGLGAAIDHLGGGNQQNRTPKWMESIGLEWLYRLFTNPSRSKRIIDSIITLWWWLTVEQFSSLTGERKTVVNIISNKQNKYLLVKRRNVLPGDLGWSFVQGGIENNESPQKAGIREVAEEIKFDPLDMSTFYRPITGQLEPQSISLARFLVQGCRYKAAKNYINFIKYSGLDNPRTNWENQKAKWFSKSEVGNMLSIEKRPDWVIANEYIDGKK